MNMMRLKKFILQSDNVARDSFVWNMVGSMLLAFQSVILLMILSRTVGLVETGVFTIAYANANLFLNIAKYGMRNFQVSDVKMQFSFRDYINSRCVSVFAMLLVSFTYILISSAIKHYSAEKSMVMIWMCLFKLPDAIEDVYYGEYQRRGRLDIASKAMTLRVIITTVVFVALILITRKQLFALVVTTCVTTIVMVIFLQWTYRDFAVPRNLNIHNLLGLMKSCFPLFAGSFLSFYIGNAPKYAIDAQLSDELQACYGFISMPIFVIGLLNGFIFNPMLYRISSLWNDGKIKEFLRQVWFQILIVTGITVACIAGAYIIGIPVLSFLYNTDLKPFKNELLILLLGGGFLGLSGLLNAVITIIRCQKALAWGYFAITLLALVTANNIVGKYQMFGAAMLYAILMALLNICFFAIFAFGVVRRKD